VCLEKTAIVSCDNCEVMYPLPGPRKDYFSSDDSYTTCQSNNVRSAMIILYHLSLQSYEDIIADSVGPPPPPL
jgi:hypothetical protein